MFHVSTWSGSWTSSWNRPWTTVRACGDRAGATTVPVTTAAVSGRASWASRFSTRMVSTNLISVPSSRPRAQPASNLFVCAAGPVRQ